MITKSKVTVPLGMNRETDNGLIIRQGLSACTALPARSIRSRIRQ